MRKAWMLGLGLYMSPIGAGAQQPPAAMNDETVTMDQLPAPVRDTLQKESKGRNVETIKKMTRPDGKIVYEAEVVKGNKGTDYQIGADGKVLNQKTHDERMEKHPPTTH